MHYVMILYVAIVLLSKVNGLAIEGYVSLHDPVDSGTGRCWCDDGSRPPETFTYLASSGTTADCRALCDDWTYCSGYSFKTNLDKRICHLYYQPGKLSTIHVIGTIGHDEGEESQLWGQNYFSNRDYMDTNCEVLTSKSTIQMDGCHLKKEKRKIIFTGEGLCPGHRQFDNDRSDLATVEGCTKRCGEEQESYFSLWKDQDTMHCSCFEKCEEIDEEVEGKSYEILSDQVSDLLYDLEVAEMHCQMESSNLKNENENLQENIDECETEKGNLQENIDECETEKGNLQENIDECETEKENVQENLDQCETEKQDCVTMKQNCENEKAELQASSDLWKKRFETAQMLEDNHKHFTDQALEAIPGEAAEQSVGQGNCNCEHNNRNWGEIGLIFVAGSMVALGINKLVFNSKPENTVRTPLLSEI